MTRFVLGLLMLLGGCSARAVMEQPTTTGYHDVGTNTQVIVPQRSMRVTAVELTLWANAWREGSTSGGAKGKGSDVIVLLLQPHDQSVLGAGLLYRPDVPVRRDEWVRIKLDRPAHLDAGRAYWLRVQEVSEGGAFGWNEYGFAAGDPYPAGGLLQDFNSQQQMDYAFRLLE